MSVTRQLEVRSTWWVRPTWTEGSVERRFSNKLGKYESRTAGHFGAMADESSTRTRTETASPDIAGLEKENWGGEVMLGEVLEESRAGPAKKRGAQIRMERPGGDMKVVGENG